MNRAGRRQPLFALAAWIILAACAGCDSPSGSVGRLVEVWGRRGLSDGRLQKPRSIAISPDDELYLVDITARIQAFTTGGQFLRGWQTPEHANGRPTGLSFDRHGNLLVADTHYFRVLVYSPQGELLETIGGAEGHGPGEFGLVTDAAEDSQGNLYVSEYGQYDRIQKFDARRQYVGEWGSHGSEPGQFVRPQKMVIDELDHVWVADAGNHRIEVFDTTGQLLRIWGTPGSGPGELYHPYDLALDGQGHLYVCEFGNHRVQKFTLDGQSLGTWGQHGRHDGELDGPWGLVLDRQGRVIVLDTNNHRVQVVRM